MYFEKYHKVEELDYNLGWMAYQQGILRSSKPISRTGTVPALPEDNGWAKYPSTHTIVISKIMVDFAPSVLTVQGRRILVVVIPVYKGFHIQSKSSTMTFVKKGRN